MKKRGSRRVSSSIKPDRVRLVSTLAGPMWAEGELPQRGKRGRPGASAPTGRRRDSEAGVGRKKALSSPATGSCRGRFQPEASFSAAAVWAVLAPSGRFLLHNTTPKRGKSQPGTAQLRGKGLGLGVDDIAPVQVPPLQAVDENLRRGHIGGEGDVVLVAEGGDILQIRVQIVGLGV